jgi:hypothetical protein
MWEELTSAGPALGVRVSNPSPFDHLPDVNSEGDGA